jgi:hypothetical protein
MSHNTLPSGTNDLLLLAEGMAHGVETHGPWLGMSEIPAEEFRRIVDQVKHAETTGSAARSAKASAQTRLTAADDALTAWLARARLVVMLARGSKWSEHWIETGFTHGATNVPTQIELRITLARRLVVFLALHPDFAVPFAGVTAAHGRPLYERLIQTRAALELAANGCMMSKRERDAAARVLRRFMRRVLLSLGSAIAPTDPRWLAFGLKPMPSRSARKRHHRRPGVAPASAKRIPVAAEIDPDSQQTAAA